MPDEIVHIETEPVSTEVAATEALVSVAETAIEETAIRVEELAHARAEITSLRSEISGLQTAFLAHVENNTVDFDALRRDHASAHERIAVLESALETAEAELAALEIETEEVEELADGAANVAEAVAEELPADAPVVVEHERETEPVKKRSRHFIRL